MIAALIHWATATAVSSGAGDSSDVELFSIPFSFLWSGFLGMTLLNVVAVAWLPRSLSPSKGGGALTSSATAISLRPLSMSMDRPDRRDRHRSDTRRFCRFLAHLAERVLPTRFWAAYAAAVRLSGTTADRYVAP